jgi:hypothetical protein
MPRLGPTTIVTQLMFVVASDDDSDVNALKTRKLGRVMEIKYSEMPYWEFEENTF